MFRIPKLRVRNLQCHSSRLADYCLCSHSPCRILHGYGNWSLLIVADIQCNFRTRFRDFRHDAVILHRLFRPFQKINIPEDTAHPELILIFEIRTIAPFQDKYGNRILALFYRVCHIELARCMGHLTVSGIGAIHPYIKAAIHALKVQVQLRCLLILRIRKRMHIRTTRNILRHIRRIKRKWIADIRILMCVIACHLPDTRHRNLIKIRRIITALIKCIPHIIDALKIPEFPHAV